MRTAAEERADLLAYFAEIHDAAPAGVAAGMVTDEEATMVQRSIRTMIACVAEWQHVGEAGRSPAALVAAMKHAKVSTLTADQRS